MFQGKQDAAGGNLETEQLKKQNESGEWWQSWYEGRAVRGRGCGNELLSAVIPHAVLSLPKYVYMMEECKERQKSHVHAALQTALEQWTCS